MGSLIKPKRIIDRKYLKWVKTKPCLFQVSDAMPCHGPIDPHHRRPRSLGGSDYTAVPMCRFHHDLAHQYPVAHGVIMDRAIPKLRAEYRKLHPETKRERPPTIKSPRLYVGFNVRNCPACLGGHTLALSKVNFDREEYACPVKGKTVSYG